MCRKLGGEGQADTGSDRCSGLSGVWQAADGFRRMPGMPLLRLVSLLLI